MPWRVVARLSGPDEMVFFTQNPDRILEWRHWIIGTGLLERVGTGLLGTIGYVVLPTGVPTDVSRDIV